MKKLKTYFNEKMTAFLDKNMDANTNRISGVILGVLTLFIILFVYVLNMKAVSNLTGDYMNQKAIWEVILGR